MVARSAIQIVHRIGALVVFCYLGWLAIRAARRGLRGYGLAIALALAAQVLLGISNVYFGLPLAVATAHNGVAALLLLTRSEERRVGKECVSTCRSLCWRFHYKKKKK